MDIALRAIVVFGLLLVVTRAVGRRELSSMEPFDLILLVVLGDLIQQGVTQSDYSLTGTLIVVAVIAVMTVGTSYELQGPRLRGVLEGEPIVLVEHGRSRAQPAPRAHDARRARGTPAVADIDECASRCSRRTAA